MADTVALACGAVLTWWTVGLVAGFVGLVIAVWRDGA